MKEKPQDGGVNRRAGLRRTALAILLAGLAALIGSDLVRPQASPLSPLGESLIRLYRAGPNRLLPHRCPSHPSCSAYALEAIELHGLVRGTILAADRLIHEPGRLKKGPWLIIDGQRKLYDPLSANIGWWSG
jgi:putative component of membrane protein insertase Oxa1/YidC/SpoIIIJ protein YidD